MNEKIMKIMREAGKLVLSRRDGTPHVMQKDGDFNFVTTYDIAVQTYLNTELAKAFPQAKFFDEEGERAELDDAFTFVIDPIDGTTNFIHGFHHSAISVAVAIHREITAGYIYDPYADEMFFTNKGAGAYLRHDGVTKTLHVTDTPMASSLVLVGTDPYRKSETWERTMRDVSILFQNGKDIRRPGAASLDFAYIAAGRADLFYELSLSPWDFAAGALLVTEAGGTVTQIDGSSLSPSAPCSVLAGNPVNHPAAVALLAKG